jgi:hypothetical protein
LVRLLFSFRFVFCFIFYFDSLPTINCLARLSALSSASIAKVIL